MIVPFGEWLPDQMAMGNGSTAISNVVPDAGGSYAPVPSLQVYSDAIGSECRGAAPGRAVTGTRYVYAGTQDKLLTLSNTSWVDVSGAVYGAAAGWSFAQVRDIIVASNGVDPVQATPLGGVFSDLFTSTRKPLARHLASARNAFLFMGDVSDVVDGAQSSRVWWTSPSDVADADPSTTTQAGYQDLSSSDGRIMSIVGGEYVTVFCEHAIYRMTYEGAPTIWRSDKISRNRGAVSSGSIVDFGRQTFFLDADGFYRFDGTQATPIGEGKVNRHFWSTADVSNLHRISAAADPVSGVIYWAYPSAGSGGMSTQMLAYAWKTDRWSQIALPSPVRLLVPASTAAISADDPSIEDLPIDSEPHASWLIDDRAFAGGALSLAAFDAGGRMGFFSGPSLPASLDTGDRQFAPSRRTRINAVRPLFEGTGVLRLALGVKDVAHAPLKWSEPVGLNNIGCANIIREGRYIRARTTIDAGWTGKVSGIEVDPVPAGLA